MYVEGEAERGGDRWTEGGGERRMTSCDMLKLNSMEWWRRGGRTEDGWMFRVKEERKWGGGTEGGPDKWSEVGDNALQITPSNSIQHLCSMWEYNQIYPVLCSLMICIQICPFYSVSPFTSSHFKWQCSSLHVVTYFTDWQTVSGSLAAKCSTVFSS